jgi:hypothetical protein
MARIRKRSDVVFLLLTKRPQRIRECLPEDWGDGWDNIFLNVTCENQSRADERIPEGISGFDSIAEAIEG